MIFSLFKRHPVKKPVVWFFLTALSLLLYTPVLKGGFVLDAWRVVVDNPVIKNPKLYPKILTSELFVTQTKKKNFFHLFPHQHNSEQNPTIKNVSPAKPDNFSFEFNYYRPLTLLSLVMNYQFGRLNPWGYQLTNILLHALNAFLIYVLLLSIGFNFLAAFFSAVFFCILPVAEWVVNYTIGRSDLLQACFELLSLIVLIGYLKNQHREMLYTSLVLFALAIFSREMAIIHPALVALMVWYSQKNFLKGLKLAIPFALIGLVYLGLRWVLMPIVAHSDIMRLDFLLTGLGHWARLTAAYTMRFSLPWSVQHIFGESFQNNPWKLVLWGAVMTGCLAWSWHKLRGQDRDNLVLGVSWIFICFLPFFITVEQFMFLGPVLSEHYLYLASVGFVILVSVFLIQIKGWPRIVCLVLGTVYCIGVVVWNNFYWSDEKILLNRVVQLDYPHRYIAYTQLMLRYNNDRNLFLPLIEQASTSVEKAQWLERLATIDLNQRRYPQAMDSFNVLLKLTPDNIDALLQLAKAHFEIGQSDKAVDYLHRALQIDPTLNDAYRFLGIIDYQKGDIQQALASFKKAYFYNSDYEDNLLYLAVTTFLAEDKLNGAKLFHKAFQQNPQDGFSYRFIAAELYQHGHIPEAIEYLQQATKHFPQDSQVWILLGKIYVNLGDIPQAIRCWNQVLIFAPHQQEAKSLLATVQSSH